GYREGTAVWVGVRPERIRLDGAGDRGLPGILQDEIYLGDRTDWRVRVGEETLTVAEPATLARARRRGEPVTVSFPPDAVLRLDDPEAEGRSRRPARASRSRCTSCSPSPRASARRKPRC